MGKSAIIKTPGDQSIREREKAALSALFINLIENHGVTEFVISCFDDANVYSLPILRGLQNVYPQIEISQLNYINKEYRDKRDNADVVIVTMGCAICHKNDSCEIRKQLSEYIGNREAFYMSDYFSGPIPVTIECLPATLLYIYNSHHRGEML